MRHALYPNERYPRGNPGLARSLLRLGANLHTMGAYGDAKTVMQRGVDMEQNLAELLLAATSEAEAMIYLARFPSARDGLISVCLHLPDSDEASYARVWGGKATVARILERRQVELLRQAAADPATRRDIETSRDIRRQLARLLLATADGHDHSQRLARLQQLTSEKERLERQLATAIPKFARQKALERSPYTKLPEVLTKHTVVVDLLSYTRFEQDPQIKGAKGRRATPSNIGFVLVKDRPVPRGGPGPSRADRSGRGGMAEGDQRKTSE